MAHAVGLGDLAAALAGNEPLSGLPLLVLVKCGRPAELGTTSLGRLSALVGSPHDALAVLLG